MRLHLYTTDPTGLALSERLPAGSEIVAVLIPLNRAQSEKVAAVRAGTDLPVFVHSPGSSLTSDVPKADAILSWLYSQIIATDLLAGYPDGGLNMHGGHIPSYRGANVLNWAIANGEPALRVTWHEMAEKVDAGGIFAEGDVPIGPKDTAWDVRGAMIERGLALFASAFDRFSRGLPPLRVPDLGTGKVWPSRRPEHGRIFEGWSRARVASMIRAQTGPWPDATVLEDQEWKPVIAIADEPGDDRIPYRLDDGSLIHLVQARDEQ